jgi:hypothetical protein
MALPAPHKIKRKSFWRDRTEQELLDYEFTITEPEKLEGMSEQPPPSGEFVVDTPTSHLLATSFPIFERR